MIKTGKMPTSPEYHKKADRADKPKELMFLNTIQLLYKRLRLILELHLPNATKNDLY